MKPFLRSQLERYAQRLEELDFLLSREDIMGDMTQYRAISKEHAEVTQVAGRYTRLRQREADLAAAREMLDDPDMAEMAQEEIASAEAELLALADEVQRLLLPKDPDDERPAFVEIRAGTGGDESALFAGDLARMYTRYATTVGWKVEVMSANESELGGYKEVVLRVEGDHCYGALRFESGGHRVQRVPATETQGRIHTSACTVAVMPEPDAAQAITLNPADLRIDTFRASGAGGQHGQGLGLVAVLAAVILALGNDAGGDVRHTHGRVGLVDVLAPGAAGTVGVDAQVGRVDLHLFGFVGLRQHRHRAGAGVDAALGFGGGHTLHTVAARFELELAIHARAFKAEHHILVAAQVGFAGRHDLHLPALALGVAAVHAQQVAGEQGRFVPAGAGTDFQQDVALVVGVPG